MSRADEHAFPTPTVTGLPNGHVDYGATGLTIREHVALEFATAIVASGRKSSSDVTGVMIEASEYARAWLNEFTRDPRS